jgi:hypothetical protein
MIASAFGCITQMLMKMDKKRVIEMFYEVILGRSPDQEGVHHYNNALDAKDGLGCVLKEFLESKEFSDVFWMNNISKRYSDFIEKKPRNTKFYLSINQFKSMLNQCASSDAESDYLNVHGKRFYELILMLDHVVRKIPQPRILEIGPSKASKLYFNFFENLELVTIDRPINHNGINDECASTLGSVNHYNIDLNTLLLDSSCGDPPLGEFDYVVCTEVLEHLTVNPVDFISSLLSLLTHDGSIYLTTPNFFSKNNCSILNLGINPQHTFPPQGDNWDAHHHYREYEMIELCDSVVKSGGNAKYAYWSDCWDSNESTETCLNRTPSCLLSNIVLLVNKA